MHQPEPEAIDGTVPWRIDEQDTCACGYQWPAGPAGTDSR
jgi:hypothetical protein